MSYNNKEDNKEDNNTNLLTYYTFSQRLRHEKNKFSLFRIKLWLFLPKCVTIDKYVNFAEGR